MPIATPGSVLHVTPLLTQRANTPAATLVAITNPPPTEEALPPTQACSDTPPTVHLVSSPSGGAPSVQGPPRSPTPTFASAAEGGEVVSACVLAPHRYRPTPPATVVSLFFPALAHYKHVPLRHMVMHVTIIDTLR